MEVTAMTQQIHIQMQEAPTRKWIHAKRLREMYRSADYH